jgi:hypothetical protein
MILTEQLKKEIDNMTYEQMLSRWRFSPVGDQMFTEESGKYFAQVMREKKNNLSESEHVKVSKDLGW